ncbi:DUF3822 family protein [Winogradskyella aurantiaca]|uniref:DUF3822 family protein n=1 Tax=Winogradskyella aurantiaca TaxID=2219558 RepID=UPI000E1CA3D1|nr:DUF3822 family protein [Winogradskyella aurantiaca]
MKQNNKVLSIQINLNGLSFCIKDYQANTVDHLHDIDFNKTLSPHEILPYLKEELSSKAVFSQDFQEVIVIHQNELSTLVPNILFNENSSADYLKFNSKILKSDYISHDVLDTLGITNVYVPFVNINNYIFDTFGQFTYKHTTTAFIESIFQSELSYDEPTFYINLSQDSFEILVLKKNTFLLSNVHEYYSKDDFLYYVLFTFEQLNLDPEINRVFLSGRIDTKDENFEHLYSYVRNIEFLSDHLDLKQFQVSNEDLNKYFVLLNCH